jgi:uncharacterized repeat protein (TIGR02543 family)
MPWKVGSTTVRRKLARRAGPAARVLAAAGIAATGLTAIGLVLSTPSAYAAGAGQICTGGTCTVTFTTVGNTTWTVPAGVTSTTFTADGAGGGDGPSGGHGGPGGEVVGTVATTPGSTYTISVGGEGQSSGAGGANGGGDGGPVSSSAAGGGGYSAVLDGSSAYEIVAGGGGGGGGAGGDTYGIGGAGGQVGATGGMSCTDGDSVATGGGGGTATGGGAGGTGGVGYIGNPGSALTGGGGAGPNYFAGGGGGGGWFGGGEGALSPGVAYACAAGGGGGSSSVPDPGVTGVSYVTGTQTGSGMVMISYPNPVSAGNLSYTVPTNESITASATAGVLTGASGPTILTASVETQPDHGSLALNSDGSFTYTPTTGYVGTDSFTYRATDTSGDYAIGTVTINVNPTVSFNSEGGSSVPAESVAYASTATAPANPTRAGYSFDGWYDAPSGGSLYDFSTPVTSSLTLYAQWGIDHETVSFNSEGGSSVPAESVAYASTATAPANPTRAGYSFDGWYDAPSGGSLYDFSTPVTSSLTLYAQWTGVIVSPSSIAQGASFTVTGIGFQPGEKITALLRSTPLPLGTFAASSAGLVTFSATVPTGFATGGHTVTLTGETSGRSAIASLVVTAAAATTTTTTPSTAPPTTMMTTTAPATTVPATTTTTTATLAFTGTDIRGPLAAAAAAVAAGIVLVAASRKRPRRLHHRRR